jgi:hypothetical protein
MDFTKQTQVALHMLIAWNLLHDAHNIWAISLHTLTDDTLQKEHGYACDCLSPVMQQLATSASSSAVQ